MRKFTNITQCTKDSSDRYINDVVASLEQVATDVAWCPNVLNYDIFAASDIAGTVYVYQRDSIMQKWQLSSKLEHDEAVTRINWTETGSILQVSLAHGDTLLYKESLAGVGEWVLLSKVSQDGDVQYE